MKSTPFIWTMALASLTAVTGCQKDESPVAPVPQAPQCALVSPANRQSLSDTVSVVISVSDDEGLLWAGLFIDDTLGWEWNTPPATTITSLQDTAAWNTRIYADSSWHTLSLEALDNDSIRGTSDTIDVMIDHSRGSGQRLLIVANQNAGTLSCLDILRGGIVTQNIIGVGTTPNDLIWDGQLYVINSGSHSLNIIGLNYNNDFTHLDSAFIGIEINRSPQYGAIAGDYLYVSNFNTHDVVKYDLHNLIGLVSFPTGLAPADVLALGDKIYVCNSGRNPVSGEFESGSVTIISTLVNQVVGVIDSIGVNPQYMAIDPGGRIHIVCTGDYDAYTGEVYIVDPHTDMVVQVITLGGYPGEIAITPNGFAYVAAGGWGGAPGEVYRYHSATGQIFNGPNRPPPNGPIQVSSGAMRIVATPDNSVWVSCYEADTVDQIISGAQAASYTIGDGPAALYYLER